MLPGSKTGEPHFQVGSDITQLTHVSLLTYQTGIGMASHQKLYQYPARLYDLGRMGLYHHTFSDWSMAGGN